MISSEVDVAPRSLADQMSDFSQRFDHDHDANHPNGSHETSSHKVYKQNSAKLTPAAYQSRFQGVESITDVNSVAITNKPNQSYHNKYPPSKTLLYKQRQQQQDMGSTQKRNMAEAQYVSNAFAGDQSVSSRNGGGVTLQSRAEMDLQLRDLEYKIGAGDRKN